MSVYAAAFGRRMAAAAGPRDQVLDEPGLVGLSRDAGRRVSLLVLDDRAVLGLQRVLRGVPGGVISVLEAASQSREMLAAVAGWSAKAVELMVSRDLAGTPTVPLPNGLKLDRVEIESDGSRCKADLISAAGLVVRADPSVTESAEAFATYLRNLSPSLSMLVAVDARHAIRATAGYRVTGPDATVLLVNTDQPWRRRGIGRAMTAAALQAASDAGAVGACLSASDAGASIYRSLGFENAGQAMQLARPTPQPG
jgi:GNAT superfamily N-acetyltransferase